MDDFLPDIPQRHDLLENDVFGATLSHHSSFSFVYVNEAGKEVESKDMAAVCIDDEICVGFLVKANYKDLLMSGKNYKLENTRSCAGSQVFAYLRDEDAPQMSTAFPHRPRKMVAHDSDSELLPVYSVVDDKMARAAKGGGGGGECPLQEISASDGIRWNLDVRCKAKSDSRQISKAHRSSSDLPPENISHPRSHRSEERNDSSPSSLMNDIQRIGTGNLGPGSDPTSRSSSSELGEPDFVLIPGDFDIVLYVDNHECNRGTNYNDEVLLKELDRHRISYKVCNLLIGDFLWVAKEKSGGRPPLVLNYVIERKRMDDLASSIIDGRFKEQKFRLRNCGLSDPIYLVESYGSMQNFRIPEDSLNQAIINTQVVDGFFVKTTRDTKETAAYLVIMTRYLESIYKRKTLLGYRRHFKQTKEMLDDAQLRLMVFDVFNESAAKTKALTVAEMFGKHLMQLHGLMAEKATVILDRYPTPKSLYGAYWSCKSDRERQELLVNFKFGLTKRNLGKQLSKMLSTLYFTEGQLP